MKNSGILEQISRKIRPFLGKYVKFGNLVSFRANIIKFGHFVNFSYIYFPAKMSFAPKLTQLLCLCHDSICLRVSLIV